MEEEVDLAQVENARRRSKEFLVGLNLAEAHRAVHGEPVAERRIAAPPRAQMGEAHHRYSAVLQFVTRLAS